MEDAVPDTRRVEEAWRSPETPRAPDTVEDDCEMNPVWARRRPEVVSVESTVDEARERKPETWVSSPVTVRVEEAFKAPETLKVETAVDEAAEMKPLFSEARPWARSVEPVVNAPTTVDEAVAVNPPDASSVKSVVEAES